MDQPSPSDLTRTVLERCTRAGFEHAGIATPEASRHAEALRAWLGEGRHGSMAWLADHATVRMDPGRLLPAARAIVMVAMRYAPPGHADAPAARLHGRIARYARGPDYHRTMKRRLHAICDRLREEHPGHQCRAFADIEPMPERELAARAGIGWVGKHTLIIRPRGGSYLVLGGFATTLPLEAPPEQRRIDDHCGTCTRCIDACPTGCITPYSVDASRCISYLTIERRLPIPPEQHRQIGDWLFGCDVCQEVCPHNGPHHGPRREPTDAADDAATPSPASLPLLDVLGWTPADRATRLSGSVIKRATLITLKRNALIVLGNLLASQPDAAAVQRIREIANDLSEPELLRTTASSVLDRLAHLSA